jgi:hypothetical protein
MRCNPASSLPAVPTILRLITECRMMIKKPRKTADAPRSPVPQRPAKPEAVIALLDRWLQDESGYDEETWPELKEALDCDRPSERKLFDV